MAWERVLAGGKLNTAKASEKELSMTRIVLGTVGTIDPTSVCEDTECDQRGELMKDHRVTHKTKGRKKGTRGECPHCKGRLHNTNDAAQLIAFQCLWRQVFGEKAKTTPVNANSLAMVVAQIKAGTISAWADRSLMYTVVAALPKPVVAPAPGTPSASSVAPTPTASPGVPRTAGSHATHSSASASPTAATVPTLPKGGTAPAASPTGTPSAASTPPIASPAPARATPAGTAPIPTIDKAAQAEKQRKLREALRGARVIP